MARIRSLCLLVLALAGALGLLYCGGGGGGGSSSPTDPQPPQSSVHIVQVKDNSYDPKTLTIQPGETVRWVLSGSSPDHTVTAKDGSFDSGTAFRTPGATFEHRFDTGGTFEYSCQAHSQCCLMRGSIKVGSNAPPPDPTYE